MIERPTKTRDRGIGEDDARDRAREGEWVAVGQRGNYTNISRVWLLPVLWVVLEKKGCASSAEKVEVVSRFVRLFGAASIESLAADREYADRGLFGYLRSQALTFRIRVKRDTLVQSGRGQVVQAWRLFRAQRTGVGAPLPGLRKCWWMELHRSGLRLHCGEYVIVAAPHVTLDALSDYGQRWEIETLFGCLKSRSDGGDAHSFSRV